jgi:hypothetical protein
VSRSDAQRTKEQSDTLHVNKVPQNITNSLVHKIKEVMRIFDRDTVAKACKWFWSRIEALVEAVDDLVE